MYPLLAAVFFSYWQVTCVWLPLRRMVRVLLWKSEQVVGPLLLAVT